MVSSNDVQRLFLQSIMSRRLVTQKVATKLWEKCIEAVRAVDEALDAEYRSDRASWDAWITDINKTLNGMDLEFAHHHDEYSGKEVYAIVNRRGDEIAQLATEYSAIEITYFKAIVEQIMLAPNESYCVSSLAALREVSFLKTSSMTKTQAEVVLASFVARGWLLKSKTGKYSLSTRTILELQSYLRQTYPDEILECTICMEMVTTGLACPMTNCQTRFHSHCYTRYRRNSDNCPTCKTVWASDQGNVGNKMRKIGEGAFKEGQERGRKTRATGDDEDEEEDDVEEPEPSQSQPEPSQSQPTNGKGKAKGKGKGKKKMVVEEEEEEEEMEVDEPDEPEQEDVKPTRTQPRRSGRH